MHKRSVMAQLVLLQRRYGLVDQFTTSARHYFKHQPVSVRSKAERGSSQCLARYRARAISISALIIVACVVAWAVQTQRAKAARVQAGQESERAEKISAFMQQVFAATAPVNAPRQEVTARELLDQAAHLIESKFDEQPRVRARLLEAIGSAYRRQDQPERAIAYLQESLQLRREIEAVNDPTLGSILTELAIALRGAGRYEEAERAFQEALQISRAQRRQRSTSYAQLLTDVGRLRLKQGRLKEAEKYYSQALALTIELSGPNDSEVGSILSQLANVRLWNDDFAGAERAAREAVSIYRDAVPELHPDRVMADSILADIYRYIGRNHDAALLYEQVLTSQRLLYGNTSRRVADTLESLADTRLAQGNVAEAEKLMREALTMDKTNGSAADDAAYIQTSLGHILARQGKYPQAEVEFREALDVFNRTLPPDHPYVASAEYQLGEVLLATNQLPEAEVVLMASMNRWKRTDALTWRIARSASALGEAIYRLGRPVEAEKYLVEGYREMTAESAVDQQARRQARERVERFYTERGQQAKLDKLMSSTTPY